MKRIKHDYEVLSGTISIEGKTILDIGCGTGELVRWLHAAGGYALGLDTPGMLAKASGFHFEDGVRFIAGIAQNLPVKQGSLDAVVYFASLHHIPKDKIENALIECHRVLKPGGRAIIVEPAGGKDSYFEVVSLVEDEREIQAFAYSLIKSSGKTGLIMTEEKFFFFERKYRDYQKLIGTFIDDRREAERALNEAREVFSRYARARGLDWHEFAFRSICRVNILEKP